MSGSNPTRSYVHERTPSGTPCGLFCKTYYENSCICESIKETTSGNPLRVEVRKNSSGKIELHVFPDIQTFPDAKFSLGSKLMGLIDKSVSMRFPLGVNKKRAKKGKDHVKTFLEYCERVVSLYTCQDLRDSFVGWSFQEMIDEGCGYSDAWMIVSEYLNSKFSVQFGIVDDLLTTQFTISKENNFTVEDPRDILKTDDAIRVEDDGDHVIVLQGVYLETTEFDDFCLKFSFENGLVVFFKRLYTCQDVEENLLREHYVEKA